MLLLIVSDRKKKDPGQRVTRTLTDIKSVAGKSYICINPSGKSIPKIVFYNEK